MYFDFFLEGGNAFQNLAFILIKRHEFKKYQGMRKNKLINWKILTNQCKNKVDTGRLNRIKFGTDLKKLGRNYVKAVVSGKRKISQFKETD